MTHVETHVDVAPLLQEWDELAARLHASPFLRPGWIVEWGNVFAPGSLAVLAARRHGELVGVAALRLRGRGLCSASNEHSPEYGFLATDRDVASELARAIFASQHTTVSLDLVDSGDLGLAACREAARLARYRSDEQLRLRSPYLLIDCDWDEYTSRLARKPRSEAERRLRRLGETGSVILEVVDGSTELEGLLDEGFRVEASGWKGERGTAIAASEETRAFYSGVARWAAARGWLRLAFLRVDGRPLAFVLGLEADGVFYSVKEGFDPAFRRFGPGGLLRYRLLARAFSTGLARYEFLGDAEPWKLTWTTTCRERNAFRAFAPSVPGYVAWALRAHVYRVAKHMPLAGTARKLLRT